MFYFNLVVYLDAEGNHNSIIVYILCKAFYGQLSLLGIPRTDCNLLKHLFEEFNENRLDSTQISIQTKSDKQRTGNL